MKIGEITSRVRSALKANNIDAFITDRQIWSVVSKHANALILKYKDSQNIISSPDLYKTIYGLEVKEASLLEKANIFLDDCIDVKIFVTKDKLPNIRTINNKYLIQSVTSVDFSYRFHQIPFYNYQSLLTNRYRNYLKNNYYSYNDNRIWIFDLKGNRDGIEKINVIASFIDSISAELLSNDDENKCKNALEVESCIPSNLLSECEVMAIQEILGTFNIPIQSDNNDNQHLGRTD